MESLVEIFQRRDDLELHEAEALVKEMRERVSMGEILKRFYMTMDWSQIIFFN